MVVVWQLLCGCAGSRADPTRLRIADIAECSSDKLSRSVRYRLRREHDICSGITVLLSLEKPRVKLIHINNPSEYQVCCRIHSPFPPSILAEAKGKLALIMKFY